MSRFWPKIHQPLPRTSRESTKLLNALTSSFRRQLDHEHPTVTSDRDGNDPPADNRNSSAQATDKHLQTILDNPLFRVSPSRDPSDRVRLDQNRLQADPMAYFDELAASGLVTTHSIVECLKQQLFLAGKSNAGTIHESMRASKAGSRVVSWWWSADARARKHILLSPALTLSLTKFMVVEGLQDRIMQWLRMLLEHDLGGRDGQVSERYVPHAFHRLLVGFMAAEKLYGRGLASAMEGYAQVCKMHSAMNHRSHIKPMLRVMFGAGSRLCRWVMDNEQNGAKDIPLPIYEEYMAMMLFIHPNGLVTSSALLYHPTKPNPQPFLEFVKGIRSGERQISGGDTNRELFIRAGVEAIRILTEQGATRDVSDLAGYLRQFLPKMESSPEVISKPSTHTPGEEDHLLGRLEFTPA